MVSGAKHHTLLQHALFCCKTVWLWFISH